MPTSSLCRDCMSKALPQSKYCQKHQVTNRAIDYRLLYDRYRSDDPIRKLYRSKRWKATRDSVLRRDILCQDPEGCLLAATVVDHYPIRARELVETLGVDAFFDVARCRAMCKPHHDRHTATQEGFARRK